MDEVELRAWVATARELIAALADSSDDVGGVVTVDGDLLARLVAHTRLLG